MRSHDKIMNIIDDMTPEEIAVSKQQYRNDLESEETTLNYSEWLYEHIQYALVDGY